MKFRFKSAARLLSVVFLLTFAFSFASAQKTQTFTGTGSEKIEFTKNGDSCLSLQSIFPEDVQLLKKDSVEITISGTANTSIDYIMAFLVENGEKTGAGWGWVELSSYNKFATSIAANKTFNYTFTLDANKSSSSAGIYYNRIGFICVSKKEIPTLTLNTFTYTISRKSSDVPISSNAKQSSAKEKSVEQKSKTSERSKAAVDEFSSIAMAKKMKIGWNLGNTFDAHSSNGKKNEGLSSEISWLPDYDGDGDKTDNYTTKANIEGIKAAGFDTIRVPVSWHNHIIDSSYTIDPKWMARVKEVVDWAYNEGLYVILNVHHDNFSTKDMPNYYGYCLDEKYKSVSENYLAAVWKQIATTFNNDYDEHLVFEVLNEPRSNVGGGGAEWYVSDKTKPTEKDANAIITEYENVCVSTIRATGGKNADRFLMAPAYAGSPSFLKTYELPTDSAKDKLILSFHAYSPYPFAMYSGKQDKTFDDSDKNELNYLFNNAIPSKFKSVGIVIGEASATNKGNLLDRVKWTSYFFGEACKNNMTVVFWDNGCYEPVPTSGEQHGYYDRTDSTWYFPSMIKAAMEAVGVDTSTCVINKSTKSVEK
ncbi:MAG: glycoside hydrolase family 5 protein [Treponema sp.]